MQVESALRGRNFNRGAHQHVVGRVELYKEMKIHLRERVFRAQHLRLWNQRLCKDITEPLVDKVVEAVMYQQMIPVSHSGEYRNLYSYDKLWDSLSHYDQSCKVNTSSRYYLAGQEKAFQLFAKPNTIDCLEAISLTGSVAQLFSDLGIREDTSAGLTAYGETKLEAFTVGLDKAVDILTSGKAPAPCLAGVRTQRNEKTRLVWMYCLEMTIIEAVIARPLIDYFKGTEHVMTFGDYSHEIGQRIRSSSTKCKYHTSIDYSKFDASVPQPMIKAAFAAFRTWFNLNQEVYEGVTVGQVFDIVEKYFITTPIVMPKKDSSFPVLVTGKRAGVPSGSYFTQLVDSFANVLCIESCNARFKLGIKDSDLYVLGDDCLFFTNGPVDLCAISSFLRTFGMKVNPSKGSHGLACERIEYLGRTWKNGFPIRKYSEIQRGALYPERFRRYSAQAGTRQQQALSVVSSYLLTSYIEDSPVRVDRFVTSYLVSPNITSGFTRYLLKEGFLPGKVMKRALY